jgi:dihydropteroate synthase
MTERRSPAVLGAGAAVLHAGPAVLRAGPAVLRAGSYELSLARPLLMGIINITPDSFSDGGRYLEADRAIAHAQRLADGGADILDLGAESTRPGALPVAVDEELGRLLPVIEGIRALGKPISVDTMKPAVMRVALAAGATMINDVRALREPGALEAIAASGAAVCLMHMQGEPRTMQAEPRYDNVVAEVGVFLRARAAQCVEAGIARERIAIDPGFGFGKTLAHNMQLLAGLETFTAQGYTVLAAFSRKSSLGELTGRPSSERLAASLAVALIAVQRGAKILRVHDVAETKDVLAVWEAVRQAESGKDGDR